MGVIAMTRKKKLIFEEMCKVNPVLAKLERLCKLVHNDHQAELYSYWYDTIKPVMVHNVGNIGPEELKSSEAYDLVYRHLTKTLGME